MRLFVYKEHHITRSEPLKTSFYIGCTILILMSHTKIYFEISYHMHKQESKNKKVIFRLYY